jgi:glycosyltransferase involved in cell wall biosynthesis
MPEERAAERTVVWVVSAFSNPASADSPDRYRFICQELTDRGASVVQFVSAFDHNSRTRRRIGPIPWRCVEVYEPGYARNVSLRRVASHLVFDSLIGFYFLREAVHGGVPDTILAALPHNGAACVAAAFAFVGRARFVVDIHDTWPESILSVTRVSPILRLPYQAWKGAADLAIAVADDVYGESVEYARRADTVRLRVGRPAAQAIYLGGDLDYYRRVGSAESLPRELSGATFLLAYAGTLGANYDLDCVLDAYARFSVECPEAGLLLLGGGEREADLRLRISRFGLKAWVSGHISHPELLRYVARAHVGLNCFKAGGNVAYSYKLNDYLLSGTPVVNSLPGESAALIEEWGLGANYRAGDPESLLDALRTCRSRWRVDPAWKERVRGFSTAHLDRKTSYRAILDSCLRRGKGAEDDDGIRGRRAVGR